jgi:hypothetical protein
MKQCHLFIKRGTTDGLWPLIVDKAKNSCTQRLRVKLAGSVFATALWLISSLS